MSDIPGKTGSSLIAALQASPYRDIEIAPKGSPMPVRELADLPDHVVAPMKHGDFSIGGTFWCSGRQWRCTDIGTRVIIAIRIDSVEVGSNEPALCRTLSGSEAKAAGWFNGPPYAVAEVVFDEDDIEGCTVEPETKDDTQ